MSTLYSTELLALAADIPHVGRLSAPTGSATCRSPVCGSTVTVDVAWDGQMRDFAIEAQTCLLGQAASALVARDCRSDLAALRAAVAAMLAGGPAPTGWEPLAPAHQAPARHAAILLPLEAALSAIEKSRQQ